KACGYRMCDVRELRNVAVETFLGSAAAAEAQWMRGNTSMQVIGAGFGRTGTMSMQAALELLGYRCYHMKEITERPGDLQAWHEFVSGRARMDWKPLFESYEATVDFPACIYYRELLQEFPDAKVVLNV